MKRLLDTSAYVALKRGHPQASSKVRLASQLTFSVIVYGELLLGFRLGSRYEQNIEDLEEFIAHSAVTLLDVNQVTADRFGRIAAGLRKAGTPIPTNDIWIAAQTMESGAELITLDRHFERIPGLVVSVLT